MIQAPTKEAYLIDTSAIMCYFQDEDGTDTVEELLIKSEDDLIELYIAFVSFTLFFSVSFDQTFLLKRKVWLRGKNMENR